VSPAVPVRSWRLGKDATSGGSPAANRVRMSPTGAGARVVATARSLRHAERPCPEGDLATPIRLLPPPGIPPVALGKCAPPPAHMNPLLDFVDGECSDMISPSIHSEPLPVKSNSPISALRRKLFRFGVSGVLATAVHVLVAAAVMTAVTPSPPLANGVAFLAATLFSYFMNTRWSFSRELHGRTLARFSVVSLVGLGLAIAISGVAQMYGLHYWIGIGLVAVSLPIITFTLHYNWTYR
jgi:putative flippase GtrA